MKAPRALIQALDAKLVPEVDAVLLGEGLDQLKAIPVATLTPANQRNQTKIPQFLSHSGHF